MAIALTAINEKVSINADNLSVLYSAAITGTYPNGGYTIDASTMPDAVAKFKNIKRVRFERDGGIDSNGNAYRVSSIDNSDPTDPTITLNAYEFATGGVGLSEIPIGQAHVATVYIEIEGIPLKGVVSDLW